MPYIYNACDVLACFWNEVRWGAAVSVIEAKTWNKPVVSNTLLYSGIGEDELDEKGCCIPLKIDELGLTIKEALLRCRCAIRELAGKYFGWDTIIANTSYVYRKVLGERCI